MATSLPGLRLLQATHPCASVDSLLFSIEAFDWRLATSDTSGTRLSLDLI